MPYSLDISKYVPRSIRYKLRSQSGVDYLISLLSPLGYTIDNVNAYRLAKLKELDYNGQTIQLEQVLNDVFDPVLRRIYILHDSIFNEVDWFESEAQEADFDFFNSEVSAGTFGTAGLLAEEGYLYFIGENPNALIAGTDGTSGTLIDFEVVAPNGFQSVDAQMKGYVDRYKLASKRYKIVYAI